MALHDQEQLGTVFLADLLSDNITFIREVSKIEMVTIFLPKVGLIGSGPLLGEVSGFTLFYPSQWLS